MQYTKRKFQVFVSSTYLDLQIERQTVIRTLLELDCIPVGMELFPSSNDSQWDFIKRIIEECDYYLVLVAGRYGSTQANGLSYTEAEYQLAAQLGKPIISLLHAAPDTLESHRQEKGRKKKQLLEFRKLCEQRLCQLWTSADSLAGKVATSIRQLIVHNPAKGWVSGHDVAQIASVADSATTIIRKLSALSGSKYVFRGRSLEHFIDSGGNSVLHDFYELSFNEQPQFLSLRYGFYKTQERLCEAAIRVWDTAEHIELESVEVLKSNLATVFAVLLPSAFSSRTSLNIKVECVRKSLWDKLIAEGQDEGSLIINKPCSSIMLRFHCPAEWQWQGFRADFDGKVKFNADRTQLEWTTGPTLPRTINYRLAITRSPVIL